MVTRNDFYKFRLDIQELNQKTEQYKILEDKIKAPATSLISAMPKSQNPDNRLEYLINERMVLSRKIANLKIRIASKRVELDTAMHVLTVSERTVLESRYYLLYSWEEIAGIIFEAYPDIKKHRDKYVQKSRLIQTFAFKKLEAEHGRV